MSTKTEIVVCRASYRKVFSAIFRRVSFSTATGHSAQNPSMSVIAMLRQQSARSTNPGWNETGVFVVSIEDSHENSEGFFDRFFDWDCGWVGVMDVRHRANHLARSSSICLLSADPRCDHRDSDYLASLDRIEFTVITVRVDLRSEPVNSKPPHGGQ